MGSWFSSPAAAGKGDGIHLITIIPKELRIPRNRLGRTTMTKEMIANLDHREITIEELYAECTCWFVHGVLKHYNANNQGAEFRCPAEMKAACTGSREDFIWYHLNFSACRGDSQEETHTFFAELCYHIDSQKLNLETCIILEKPSISSGCAFCPEESKIMHPSETEFVCGKEGQQPDFFCIRDDMLLWPWEEACPNDLDLKDGPTTMTPTQQNDSTPQYFKLQWEDFIWYHLNFSAFRGDNQEETHIFFAELCYDIESEKLNLETCIILEKPSISGCAFCPEESKIMHPSEPEFVCGKEGQQPEFFSSMRDMLLWPWEEACPNDLDLSDGPTTVTPTQQHDSTPPYFKLQW